MINAYIDEAKKVLRIFEEVYNRTNNKVKEEDFKSKLLKIRNFDNDIDSLINTLVNEKKVVREPGRYLKIP